MKEIINDETYEQLCNMSDEDLRVAMSKMNDKEFIHFFCRLLANVVNSKSGMKNKALKIYDDLIDFIETSHDSKKAAQADFSHRIGTW